MRYLLFILLSLFSLTSISQDPQQSDKFHGVWQVGTLDSVNRVYAKLEIGSLQDHIVYPARLSIRLNEFEGEYQFMLFKKNVRQLAIGHPKKILTESPFSLEKELPIFNGLLDLSGDRNGNQFLTINRLRFKTVHLKPAPPASASTLTTLHYFLQDAEIRWKKISDKPWDDLATIEEMMKSPYTGFYYGKKDTFYVEKERGICKFAGKNNGILSATINGKKIFDYAYANDKKESYEIKLEPGLNMLALFVENYGKKPQHTGQLDIDFISKKTNLNFYTQQDYTAGVITIPILVLDRHDTTSLRNNLQWMKEQIQLRNEKMYFFPNPSGEALNVSAEVEKSLLREATQIGKVETKSKEVILAIWDDAVEDGDSISLNINGTWVVQGLPVLKRPQFIVVQLNAGVNKIVFIADNQGSIIPNTSMLEIIDDRQRKSYKINTDYHQNNLIDIMYQVGPPDNKP